MKEVIDVEVIVKAHVEAVYEDEVEAKDIEKLLEEYGPVIFKDVSILFVGKKKDEV